MQARGSASSSRAPEPEFEEEMDEDSEEGEGEAEGLGGPDVRFLQTYKVDVKNIHVTLSLSESQRQQREIYLFSWSVACVLLSWFCLHKEHGWGDFCQGHLDCDVRGLE
jgi:hypothetical protein